MKARLSWCGCLLAALLTAIGCSTYKDHNLPPAQRLMEPGPGVGGPGPGVMMMGAGGDAGMGAPGCGPGFPIPRNSSSQVAFIGPDGMAVNWDISQAGLFDSEPLIAPGRQNFAQGAIYRLKLTNVPGRPGVELYPTLEVGPTTPRTDAFLAHNAIPVQFTEEDFDQVQSGNFVTKVIYLPDPEFQALALAGVETLVSTRLDPGVDPIVEADRRGAIMAIVRLGNKDLEVPGTEGGFEAGADGESVLPIGYNEAAPGAPIAMSSAMASGYGAPYGVPTSSQLPVAAPPHVSGVTAPQWGMPMSGTPIGLPGPPHIPLGVPAGLQKHVMKNRTHVHMPEPTDTMRIDVRQKPGMSYPKPVNRVRITERVAPRNGMFFNPWWNKNEIVK
ncbi:MAG: hypothetical protein KDA42_09950 [Planctomycetales bacterium]|nr:hypothetical protein [Planctomycetales bacterium]